MHNLESIAERIHESFTSRSSAREEALAQARALTRHCANAIRAIHREERELALQELQIATGIAGSLQNNQHIFPD
ncbi:MAG: haloacid dehalogenase, partial [Anaerolineales bacterium]